MIALLPTESLQIALSAAPATGLPYSFAYADTGAAGTVGSAKGSATALSTTAVPGPATGAQRVVRSGFVYNSGSANATVGIVHFDGTTAWELCSFVLGPGATLQLVDDGFSVTASGSSPVEPSTDRVVVPFAYGDASPTTIFTPSAACTAILTRVVIDTPFNGTGAALQVGTSAQPAVLMPASANDPTNALAYDFAADLPLAAAQAVQLTITPGAGATAGAGRIILDAIA